MWNGGFVRCLLSTIPGPRGHGQCRFTTTGRRIWCVRGVDMWLTRKIPATIQGKGLGKVPHKVKRAVKAAHGGLEHSSWDTFLQTLWLAGATPPALVSAWKWQGQDARTSMKNVARTWQTPARSAGGPTSCNGTISLIRVCVTLCAMVRYL